MQYSDSRQPPPPSKKPAPHEMFKSINNKWRNTLYPPRYDPVQSFIFKLSGRPLGKRSTLLETSTKQWARSVKMPLIEVAGKVACGYNNHSTATTVQNFAKNKDERRNKAGIIGKKKRQMAAKNENTRHGQVPNGVQGSCTAYSQKPRTRDANEAG